MKFHIELHTSLWLDDYDVVYRFRILPSGTVFNLALCRICTVLTVVLALICLIAFAGCLIYFLLTIAGCVIFLLSIIAECVIWTVLVFWVFKFTYWSGLFFPLTADYYIHLPFASVVVVFFCSCLFSNFLSDDFVFVCHRQLSHLFCVCYILLAAAVA